MRILLINIPSRESLPAINFPLSHGYLAAVLQKAGHDVRVLDINAYRYGREKAEDLIKRTEFDVAATGGLITAYSYIKWLSKVVKKHHPKNFFVVGGALPTSAPQVVLKNTEADAIVLGEGEYTICELAKALEKGRSLESVKGIWFKKGKKIVKNEPRELIQNLDELPFPAWDLFPMQQYLRHPKVKNQPLNIKSMNISSVRGCPFNCAFCYNVFGRGTVRVRGVDSVIAEIKLLKERYGVKAVKFSDNVFGVNKRQIIEFCDKLVKQKLDIIWETAARVDSVDAEVLGKMKQAGCQAVAYGFESGSQKMLDAMHKHVKVEQMKKAIRLTREAGIELAGSFMVGIPGETPETIKETVEFIKEMDLFVPCIFITNPYCGSEYYAYAKRKGLITNEEKTIEKFGAALDLSVNLTDMSDKELIYWRDWAMREVISHYRKKHPLKAIAMDVRKIKSTIKNHGLVGTFKKAVNRIKRR